MFGVIKSQPEDFFVSEQLGFTLAGEGEHVWLRIQKRLLNTQDVQKKLAKFVNVPRRDVGYSGLKDKDAVTEQWFSLWLPHGQDFNWKDLNDDALHILEVTQHTKKLKVGTHSANRFKLVIRNCQVNTEKLMKALADIEHDGFLNYFGEQRFGFEDKNIQKAVEWLKGEINVKSPKDQGFLLSVLRSKLFNQYIEARAKRGLLNQALLGDIVGFPGANSWFAVEESNLDEVNQRLKAKALVIAGILPGQDKKLCLSQEALAIAEEIWQSSHWWPILQSKKVEAGFRTALVWPSHYSYTYNPEECSLLLEFELPRGSYATSLIGQLNRILES